MSDVAPYPPIEPYDSGMLDVGGGHHVYWCSSGNPEGKPVVLLHGGPGSGSSPGHRRMYDPSRHRIVQFDQRGCGRSTPSAAERVVDLTANTTQHLIADIERLRNHLGIERWHVWGGSWGTTLGLAYAQSHPERVTDMILLSVVTTSRQEVEWVTRAMGRVFPEAWERFVKALPEADRGGDLAAAYARLLQDLDPLVHEPAARAWCAWEDTHVATAPDHAPSPRYDDLAFRLCFARLVTHYWSNAAFLPDGGLLDGTDRLAGVPATLIHGRLDISGPADIAWQLARRWPAAELVIVEGAGHTSAALGAAMDAADRRAARI